MIDNNDIYDVYNSELLYLEDQSQDEQQQRTITNQDLLRFAELQKQMYLQSIRLTKASQLRDKCEVVYRKDDLERRLT